MIGTLIVGVIVAALWVLFVALDVLLRRARRAREVTEYGQRMADVENSRAAYRAELVRLERGRKRERDRALRVTNDYLEGTKGFGR